MQPELDQFLIPVEFADYRRRLIIYNDPTRLAGERLASEFRTLLDTLQKEFGTLPQSMQFCAGETVVRVVYLADRRFSVGEVIAALRKRPHLDAFHLEPDTRMTPAQLGSGDRLYPEQWALTNIEAAAAWQRLAQVPPRPPVTVAIVDSGIDAEHEDFVGLDMSGLSIIGGTLADDTGHGTMIAGIIGAVHNAIGVAGAAPNARILAIKITDERTPPSALAGALGILAAVAMGAQVINLSWHVLATTSLLRLAIQIAGLDRRTVVAAAGNYGSNNSRIPTLPASYALSNMVVTMASDRHDDKCWFSNYGPTVDLAAPGMRVLSTGIYYVHPRYPDDNNGTSAAAAYVSAAASLLLGIDDWTPQEIREHLNASADRFRSLEGICRSNGRLNLRRAVCGPFHIVQPAGGEMLESGSTFDVRWTSDYADPVIGNVEIFAMRQGGGASISLGVFPDSGVQPVTLPNLTMPAFIRLKAQTKNLYADSAPFEIV